MNKKREPYDRIAVGERIRHKRIQLGLSQDELAVRINRATKYCSDIERGMCVCLWKPCWRLPNR